MTQLLSTFQFQYARDFASFLLNHKLEEACAENLRLSRMHNLPLLKLFEQLSEEELQQMIRQSLSAFFQQIVDGTALEKAFLEIDRWKADQIPGIPREKVAIADLVSGYSINRQMFLRLLPQYTSDCQLMSTLLTELENYYIQLQRYAFEAYMDIYNEELHKKNEFLASLINNSIDGIAAFDASMRVLEWNPVLEQINGIKKEQIIGRYIYDVFPAYKNSPEAEAAKQAFTGKTMYLADRSYKNRQGWFDAHVVPFYGKGREVTGTLTIIRDITARKQAEIIIHQHQEELLTANGELQEQKEELAAMNEELQENLAQLEEIQQVLNEKQERLLEAQAIAHLGNWEYNPEKNAVYWSDEMKKIFGYQVSDLSVTFNSYINHVHPEDQKFVGKAVAECIHNFQPFEMEHRIIRTDGAVRWLLCQGKAEVRGNSVSRLVGTALDITERKEAEIRVLEDQHFINTIADTSPDVISVYDLEKKQNLYSSKEIYEILSYSPQELEALKQKGVQGLVEVIHPEDLPMILNFLETYKTYTGSKAREMEYRIKDNQGIYHWILDRYNVFKRSPEGLPVQIVGIARDITPRKQAEEELKRLNVKLQKANKELVSSEEALKELNNELEYRVERRTSELMQKNEQLSRINADLDNFIYTASHDLKSPIANIDGLLTALTKRVQTKIPPQDLTMLSLMRHSVDRFNSTILDLTNIAKVQKNIEEEEIEQVSFTDLINEVKSDVSQLMAEKQALVHEAIETDVISFAKRNLRSVLYNLLTNALKYSAPDRKPIIQVSTRTAGDFILLSVHDNGVGIPQGQQQKIFSLFKRVHTNVEGSGIGLYIVKRIVENNGGKVEVESEVGKGTTFYVYLKNTHPGKHEGEQLHYTASQ